MELGICSRIVYIMQPKVVQMWHASITSKISADMKVSEQCGIAASKGNKILGLIRRNITYKGKS